MNDVVEVRYRRQGALDEETPYLIYHAVTSCSQQVWKDAIVVGSLAHGLGGCSNRRLLVKFLWTIQSHLVFIRTRQCHELVLHLTTIV